MSRMIDQPCDVTVARDDDYGLRPCRIVWRHNRFTVQQVLETFTLRNRWWEQEEETAIWRVQLVGGGVMELEQCATGRWKLYRVLD